MRVRDWALAGAMSSALVTACTPSTSSSAGSSGTSGSSGSSGEPSGSSGSSGAAGGGPELPAGTLLYVRAETSDKDILVARDLESGDERVVTDLTGDGSSGWNIWGYSLSPDRRRIAIASLYGPTKEDTATGLATRAIWTLATDGTDFRRLTPTFPNRSGGRNQYQIDVSDPMWTANGANVVFDFGEYWWEGTNLRGGTFPWIVSAAGGEPPSSVPTPTDCTVLRPARNPATGDMLFIHSVCIPGSGTSGLYLYPEEGSTKPKQLLASSRATGGIDVFLATPSWIADGSGFLFVGSTAETDWTPSVLAYDTAKGTATTLVVPPSGRTVDAVAISPDGSKIVYCLRDPATKKEDLHLIDVSAAKPTDVAITNDGKSCDPSF